MRDLYFLILVMLVLIFLGLITAGCGGKVMYYKSGASQSDFERAKYECEMYARQIGWQASGPSTGKLGLGSSIGGGIGGGIIMGIEINRAMDTCMRSKGWVPRSSKVEPPSERGTPVYKSPNDWVPSQPEIKEKDGIKEMHHK